MAALVIDDTFDLSRFRAHLLTQLPDYALPLFLRMKTSIDVTPSFKPMKTQLVREGYDPAIITDPL